LVRTWDLAITKIKIIIIIIINGKKWKKRGGFQGNGWAVKRIEGNRRE